MYHLYLTLFFLTLLIHSFKNNLIQRKIRILIIQQRKINKLFIINYHNKKQCNYNI